MASPVPPQPDRRPVPVTPPAEPAAIRACLTPDLVAVFDREWEFVLEQAKRSHDLGGIHELLGAWRFHAHAEQLEPGSYFRTLAVAARIQATGSAAPSAASADEVRALIRARLAG